LVARRVGLLAVALPRRLRAVALLRRLRAVGRLRRAGLGALGLRLRGRVLAGLLVRLRGVLRLRLALAAALLVAVGGVRLGLALGRRVAAHRLHVAGLALRVLRGGLLRADAGRALAFATVAVLAVGRRLALRLLVGGVFFRAGVRLL